MKMLVTSARFQLIAQDVLKIIQAGLLSILAATLTYFMSAIKPEDFQHFGVFQTLAFVFFSLVISTLLQWIKKSEFVMNMTHPQHLILEEEPSQPIQVETSSIPLG